jgi:predicted TIM-barrel fold metal-dependent hydrolase
VTQRKPRQRPNRIDVSHHIAPPGCSEAIGPENMPGGRVGPRAATYAWTPALAIEDMNRGGTATAITSVCSGTRLAEHPKAARLARECNEFAARMMQDFPGRFGMFASLPALDVDATLKEIEYSLDVLGADGVHLATSYRDKWLGDRCYAPIFEELNRRKAVLYTHPAVPAFARGLVADVPDAVIEAATDTTRAVASLVFSGAAARYAGVDIIFSHGGGTLPFLIERFARLAERNDLAARMPRGFMHEVRRFYYDLAQVAAPAPMAALLTLVPATQVLFGTGFASRSAAETAAGLAACKLGARRHKAIGRDNALRLFPRFRHVQA